MILILDPHLALSQIEQLQQRLTMMGFDSTASIEGERKALAIVEGMNVKVCTERFSALPGVVGIEPLEGTLKLVGRGFKKTPSQVQIKDVCIGGDQFVVMAGPCSIESEAQIFSIAEAVKAQGASILRGGAFKPRTSTYDFQGLGERGLMYLKQAAAQHGMVSISEVMSTEALPCVAAHVDILQIGARNMQNFNLLKAVGQLDKPVLLKRGLSATYREFLSAAEYIMREGNSKVMLCERGIRTFETHSRNTLDLAAVPLLREMTHLPIIVDPSHGVGLRHAVPPLVHAAAAVKANGVMVEVHTHPDQSVSDAAQTIGTEAFSTMMKTLRPMAKVLGLHVNEVIPCPN